jgi:hypothetical protein
VFDVSGTERLTEWRKIRDDLQNSSSPYNSVLEVWKRAPLVNPYLDPNDPGSWPDPWHLILDNRYDELALALGIVYTLGLSERFMSTEIEIHMSILEDKITDYFVVCEDVVIDVGCREIRSKSFISATAKSIWTYQNRI